MDLALYKGGHGFIDSMVDAVIRARTNSIYSHCEIVFRNGARAGQTFSSVHQVGCRFTAGTFLHDSPQDWDIVALGDLDEDKIYAFCQAQNRKPYDQSDVVRFLLDLHAVQTDRDWFCSDVCADALQQDGWCSFLKPVDTSPAMLAIAAYARLPLISK